jgi:hypothetical protein
MRPVAVGIGLLFSSQFALEVGFFNDDILELDNASVDVFFFFF